MELNKKYIDFIIENLFTGNASVELPEPLKDGGTARWKLGPVVSVSVSYEVLEKYSRSAKFLLKFDKYQIEQLVYLPIEHGPYNIYNMFLAKVSKVVYDTYINDGRKDEIQQLYADRRAQIGAALAKAFTNNEQST